MVKKNNTKRENNDKKYLSMIKKTTYLTIIFICMFYCFKTLLSILEGRIDLDDVAIPFVFTNVILSIMLIVPMLRKSYLKKIKKRNELLQRLKQAPQKQYTQDCSVTIDMIIEENIAKK